MRFSPFVFLLFFACSESSESAAPTGVSNNSPDGSAATTDGSTSTTPDGSAPDTCPATGSGAVLKIDGKSVRVDLTRKRVFTGGTVIEFGFEDISQRPLDLDEYTFGIKLFVKQGEASADWQVSDLESGVVNLYHVIDQTDVTGKRLSMHYVTPNGFTLTSPGFTLTRVGDQGAFTYKGQMNLSNLAPDSVPKQIEIDGCVTLALK
jgi:hypothetical protein